MGSNLNFKSFGFDPPGDGGGRPPGSNFPLTRQSSIYALTFDEFQHTVGGSGKDFGSMNMDELLKSIWSAEENQNIGSTSGAGVGNQEGVGYLQRQGSLTLPRTISQKTVDEVWRDMSKEYNGGKDANGGIVGFGIPQREPTLGEVTLEEFLVRAGVVREEAQLAAKTNNVGFFGDLSRAMNDPGLGFSFHQQPQQGGRIGESTNQIGIQGNRIGESTNQIGIQGNRIGESTNQIGIQSANLPLNVNGVRSAAQQLGSQQQPMRHQQQQQQQQPPQQQQPQQILPKQPALGFGAPMAIPTTQLASPRIRAGIAGMGDPSSMANAMAQNAALQGVMGLGANGVSVATASPAVSTDGVAKSNGDTSSLSPVPYVFNGGMRGRKTAALEKVVERRQRRMIKNRESAARSRARKQAYTTELEAEVAKLKEENEELRKKQEEMMEMQKNQVLEMMNQRPGSKRRCLRRTQTGIW